MAGEGGEFTAEQAAKANSVLRAALDLAPQRFGLEQFVGMISDEIEQLRDAGKSDADIAKLVSDGVGIDVDAGSIGRYYADPSVRGRPE